MGIVFKILLINNNNKDKLLITLFNLLMLFVQDLTIILINQAYIH